MQPQPDPQELLGDAADAIRALRNHTLDVLSVRRPLDTNEGIGWAKIVSKLSPLLGNLMEFEIVRVLNGLDLPNGCEWVRQDPGFPDAALVGVADPPPGIELKAWFPLATEITGRFKESQRRLLGEDVMLAVVCWLPEYVLFGRPIVLGAWVSPALSVAQCRDNHYYQPPLYLVREPEDTSARTANLQQTVTSGFRVQETGDRLEQLRAEVAEWPDERRRYSPDESVQQHIRDLLSRYNYRLDTNYAKIDRIDHPSLEEFKTQMLGLNFHGKTVLGWAQEFTRAPERAVEAVMALGPDEPAD